MTSLTVFTVGGTIDKVYFDSASQYEIGDPQIGRLLQIAGISDFIVVPLMRKDSLDMTDADRAVVRDAVLACDSAKVLITHGTDTMAQTAQLIGDCGKAVVFTGAMQPARFQESDAAFNVGFAMGVLASAVPGVYVAMSGEVFNPHKVRKNRAKGRFEANDDSGNA